MARWPQAALAGGSVAAPASCTALLDTGTLTVHAQPGPYPLDALVDFAARANAKRGFLFVSKVLGKHWPARPSAMAALHDCLARGVPADLPGPVVFIAMAETAVGLGQGVFEAWRRGVPVEDGIEALFLHTTRYRVGDGPLIEFEEAHSHAPRQFLHMPVDAAMAAMLRRARTIVLVDDEASTGNTFVNLAAAFRAVAPGISDVHLVTLTNFMGEAATDALQARMGLRLGHNAALTGSFSFAAADLAPGGAPAQRFDAAAESGASRAFGRLGLTEALAPSATVAAWSALSARLAAQFGASGDGGRAARPDRGCAAYSAAATVAASATTTTTTAATTAATAAATAPAGPPTVLVLGTGEFMHPAFLLAQALERLGLDVVVQATTRSPVLVGAAIGSALAFADNYGEGIANYLYNVRRGQYDHVLICHETPAGAALQQLAAQLNARLLHFTSELTIEEIPVR